MWALYSYVLVFTISIPNICKKYFHSLKFTFVMYIESFLRFQNQFIITVKQIIQSKGKNKHSFLKFKLSYLYFAFLIVAWVEGWWEPQIAGLRITALSKTCLVAWEIAYTLWLFKGRKRQWIGLAILSLRGWEALELGGGKQSSIRCASPSSLGFAGCFCDNLLQIFAPRSRCLNANNKNLCCETGTVELMGSNPIFLVHWLFFFSYTPLNK